ncbi:MAG: Calx-beta domain-containing protein [Pacificimonas sp.]|jgi:Ca2+-binding RTX toxin-like protein|nr:Calx-beta domain-containing protein [Pacificimonas sp.]
MPIVILSAGDTFFAAGPNLNIFGKPNGAETVNIFPGAEVVLDPSFNRGGDTISFNETTDGYTITRSGSNVIITGEDGTSVTIPVGINDTTVAFQDETFDLSFNQTSNEIELVSSGGETITVDADGENIGEPGTGGGPVLTVESASVTEGAGNLVFQLTLDAPRDVDTVVQVSTSGSGDSPATAGSDFVPFADSITIPAGATTRFVTVQVLDDNNLEGDETLTLNVTPPAGVTLAGDGEIIGTIIDNESVQSQEFDLTTGADTFTGDAEADRFVGTQTQDALGKLLSQADAIDGAGGTDSFVLINDYRIENVPFGPPQFLVTPQVVEDADLTNVTSVERLLTNYTSVTLAGEASEAGLFIVDTSFSDSNRVNLAGNPVGATVDVSSSAYTLSAQITNANEVADVVLVDLSEGSDTLNTGFGVNASNDLVDIVAEGNVMVTLDQSLVGNNVGNTVSFGLDGGPVSTADDEGTTLRFLNNVDNGFRFMVMNPAGDTVGSFGGVILGTSFNDNLQAIAGYTIPLFIATGAGNDTLGGGLGIDVLDGGVGNDTYIYDTGEFVAAEGITDAGGDDTINVSSLSAITDDLFANKAGIENGIFNVETDGVGAEVTLAAAAQASGLTDVTVTSGQFDATAYTVGLTARVADNAATGAGNDSVLVAQNAVATQTIATNGGDDIIQFYRNFDSADMVDGGMGSDTILAGGAFPVGTGFENLNGVFAQNYVLTDGDVQNVERLVLASGQTASPVIGANDDPGAAFTYTVTLGDALLDSGDTFTIDGTALRTGIRTALGADGEIGGTGVNADTLTAETLMVLAGGLSADRNVTATGGAANDTFVGGAGTDTFFGGAGNDSLNGGAGVDTLDGQEGSDTYVFTGTQFAEGETITDSGTGATDVDTLDINANTGNIADAAFANITGIEALNVDITAAGGMVTLAANAQASGIRSVTADDNEQIDASAYTVDITIISGGNSQGGSGNDLVFATGGNTIEGNGGDDALYLSNVGGAQVVNGDAGNDTIFAYAFMNGDDVDGGSGTDNLILDQFYLNSEVPVPLQSSTAPANAGNPATGSGARGATSTYTPGLGALTDVEVITLGAGFAATTTLNGSTTDYVINLVDANIDNNTSLTVDGSALRADVVTNVGTGATDDEMLTVNGGGLSQSRSLIVLGGAAMDTITGGAGNDNLSGNGGNDILIGNGGNDTLMGGAGNDDIRVAFTEFDTNNNVGDTDIIDGGTGTDRLTLNSGGLNRELFDIDFASGVTSIEEVFLTGGGTFTFQPAGSAAGAGVTTITVDNGTAGNIDAGNFGSGLTINGGNLNDTINGTGNNDVIVDGLGNDTINARSGNDVIALVGGSDTVDAGVGNDIVRMQNSIDGTDVLDGGLGNDTLEVQGSTTSNDTEVFAIDNQVLSFNTVLLDGGTEATAVAGAANDTAAVITNYNITSVTNASFDGATSGTLTINASDLTARVTGLGADGEIGGTGANADTTSVGTLTVDASLLTAPFNVSVTGGAGNDTITGGAGADILIGGAGVDTLIGGAGLDSFVLTETAPATDFVVINPGDSSRAIPDVVTGFTIDTDIADGIDANVDRLQFVGETVLADVTGVIDDGVVVGTLASAINSATSLLAAVQLLEQELQSSSSAGAQDGVVAFSFGGQTYVADVAAGAAVDANNFSETVADLVQLSGVTGVTDVVDAGGGNLVFFG